MPTDVPKSTPICTEMRGSCDGAKGREKGRSPVPWGGGSSDPMIDADAPSTEEVVCKLAERARPTGGRHGLTTEAFTLLISIGILLEIPKGPEPCVVGSSDLMREAGAPSTSGKWKSCTRPTGDGHDRTTDTPEQCFNGVNLRATLEVGYEKRGYARSGTPRPWSSW